MAVPILRRGFWESGFWANLLSRARARPQARRNCGLTAEGAEERRSGGAQRTAFLRVPLRLCDLCNLCDLCDLCGKSAVALTI